MSADEQPDLFITVARVRAIEWIARRALAEHIAASPVPDETFGQIRTDAARYAEGEAARVANSEASAAEKLIAAAVGPELERLLTEVLGDALIDIDL